MCRVLKNIHIKTRSGDIMKNMKAHSSTLRVQSNLAFCAPCFCCTPCICLVRWCLGYGSSHRNAIHVLGTLLLSVPWIPSEFHFARGS